MSTVYVLHHAHDNDWVTTHLLRPLPAFGFGRWVSSGALGDSATRVDAMERSAVILAVVSESALADPAFADEAKLALDCRTAVVPVFLATPDFPSAPPVLGRMWRLARIDGAGTEGEELWRQLDMLLPPPADLDKVSVPMRWDVEAFSTLLREAAARNDQSRMAALVDTFRRYDERPSPYPHRAAHRDLAALRDDREFLLMRRYASSATRPGTTDFTVRRQLAQSLIELKEFDAAIEVLNPLVADTAVLGSADARREHPEARGLLGRCHKQRYVDAGDDGNPEWLIQAIEAYWSVFEESERGNEHLWHGVNAATCILRAHRDGVAAPPVAEARRIAEDVLRILGRREQVEPLNIWDSATQVEAHLALGDYDAAARTLDHYLNHPEIKPFEVSSTYRQFDEVLQLGDDADERGRKILVQLAKAAGRQRAVGLDVVGPGVRPLLVRVTDPSWEPEGQVPDLTIRARLGTMLSINGSDETVAALLKDPQVTNIEESRPAGSAEGDPEDAPQGATLLDFVRVAKSYTGADGLPFREDGDHALVAIIDTGIDVLHPAFQDGNGESRIIGVWDQRDPSGKPPQGCPPGSGTYHSEVDIARYIKERAAPPALAVDSSHGTHVASIAAGHAHGEFTGGVAPGAQVLVVLSNSDGPTGYSSSHLEALSFIKKTARSLGRPVVVNVSLGANAGAHDGTSAVEAIFDTFSGNGRDPGRVVVKSAGNLRGKAGHAKINVARDTEAKLRIRSGPLTPVKVELWWDSGNKYRFRLTAPTDASSDWVEVGNPHVAGYFQRHGRYRLNLVRRHIDNGDSLLEVSFRTGYRREATNWTLEIESVEITRDPALHAWIERDQEAKFLDHTSDEMTLTVPGTARTVITVGSIKAGERLSVGPESSFGPTRDGREKPDVCAPGVDVEAARSGGGVVVHSGTSMAAPHVTGAIALLLSKAARTGEPIPTASQIGKALRQNTRNASGRWDCEQGYGALDVAALLQGF